MITAADGGLLMSLNTMDEYWVPEHVKEYLRGLGFVLPLDDMEPWIRSWDDWMGARGDFYDYRDKDGLGRVYEVHRRSIHPAMRVCKEWGLFSSTRMSRSSARTRRQPTGSAHSSLPRTSWRRRRRPW